MFDFGTTAGVPDSTAMGGACNLVSSSGNLQEKETSPMDKGNFHREFPIRLKWWQLEKKHEQSIRV